MSDQQTIVDLHNLQYRNQVSQKVQSYDFQYFEDQYTVVCVVLTIGGFVAIGNCVFVGNTIEVDEEQLEHLKVMALVDGLKFLDRTYSLDGRPIQKNLLN